MILLLLFLATTAYVQSSDQLSYRCFPTGNNAGLCRTKGHPNYKYNIYINYNDMSFKVLAKTKNNTMPSYTCKIDGWLTPQEVTLECTAECKGTCTNTTFPQKIYCTASRKMSVCVN